MTLIQDLFPEPGALGEPSADVVIAAIRTALLTQNADIPPGVDPTLFERLVQANAKIAGRVPIRRLSELMTLAQFGAGSAGKMVAGAAACPAAIGVMEALFMGKFLISVVCSSDTYPQLIPQELLARHGVDRTRMEDARAMRPVNDEILNRAADALQASAPMTRDGLSRYVNRQRLISERRIRRLRRYDPRSAAAGLRPIDHFLVSARLLLRR